MKHAPKLIGLIAIFQFFLLGCSPVSYHPWLEKDFLVEDDSMSGVWLAVEQDNAEGLPEDIFIVRSLVDSGEKSGGPDKEEFPEGFYAISWIEDEDLREAAGVEKPFMRPKQIFGGLYRVDDDYFVQVWGSTLDDGKLVAPLHMIFKVRMENEFLYLHSMALDNLETTDFAEEGLMFEAEKDQRTVFFSPAEKMTEFLQKHHKEEGFFNSDDPMILKRIRDLSKEDIDDDEELVPIP